MLPRFPFAPAALLLPAAVATLVALAPLPALARPDGVSQNELSRMPEYCIDTEGFGYGHKRSANRSPRASHWEGLMGDGFWTLHHYCYGLIYRDRLLRRTITIPARRTFTVGQMIAEYYFVIQNTGPDFILLPEVWVRIGEGELMRENIGAAHDAFREARRLRPDYWPAYTLWAEVLMRARAPEKARQVLAEGLSHAPDSRELLEAYRAAGGDPARLPPRRAIAAAATPAPVEAAPAPASAPRAP
jgi:tetratricopeptide (TPR) repeat protein